MLLLLLLLWSRELLVGEVTVLTRVIRQGGDRVLGKRVLLLRDELLLWVSLRLSQTVPVQVVLLLHLSP